jgi:hypothetical protein
MFQFEWLENLFIKDYFIILDYKRNKEIYETTINISNTISETEGN